MDTQEVAARPLALTLLPIMTAVFVVFLITGATLPALPLHISSALGYGAFVVGSRLLTVGP